MGVSPTPRNTQALTRLPWRSAKVNVMPTWFEAVVGKAQYMREDVVPLRPRCTRVCPVD